MNDVERDVCFLMAKDGSIRNDLLPQTKVPNDSIALDASSPVTHINGTSVLLLIVFLFSIRAWAAWEYLFRYRFLDHVMSFSQMTGLETFSDVLKRSGFTPSETIIEALAVPKGDYRTDSIEGDFDTSLNKQSKDRISIKIEGGIYDVSIWSDTKKRESKFTIYTAFFPGAVATFLGVWSAQKYIHNTRVSDVLFSIFFAFGHIFTYLGFLSIVLSWVSKEPIWILLWMWPVGFMLSICAYLVRYQNMARAIQDIRTHRMLHPIDQKVISRWMIFEGVCVVIDSAVPIFFERLVSFCFERYYKAKQYFSNRRYEQLLRRQKALHDETPTEDS